MPGRTQAEEPIGLHGIRLMQVLGVLLLVLALGMTALLYERLPETIATKWSGTGRATSTGHRDLAWLGPMVLAFVVGLGLVTRRHLAAREQAFGAAVVLLACSYLFSLHVLALLANVDDQDWRQGSVSPGWMLLALTLPASVFGVGCFVWRARRRPAGEQRRPGRRRSRR